MKVYQDKKITIHQGNCLEVLKSIDCCCIDSVITDPPYGLKFMGKEWDHGVPGVSFWEEILRVSKPGAHLLAFGGTRTFHRLMVAIEDAGWEIRDTIMWVYGSGFPKSHDISKGIDKMLGKHKKVVVPTKTGNTRHDRGNPYATQGHAGFRDISTPVTPQAKQWNGWGTALKPAWESIILARKPVDGSIVNNVLRHGVGGINIDGCRVLTGDETGREKPEYVANDKNNVYGKGMGGGDWENTKGRWPANLIHDGSDEVVGLFPVTTPSNVAEVSNKNLIWGSGNKQLAIRGHNDSGGQASRFFYCAKADKKDRGKGNTHPTVKPNSLLRYLVCLITPPDGIVLDPFAGSGSTGLAARDEEHESILIELDEKSCQIGINRIREGLETARWLMCEL